MKPTEKKQIEDIAWHICLLLSDNNLDMAKRKFEALKE